MKFSQSKILKNLNRYFGILLRLGYYENHEIAKKNLIPKNLNCLPSMPNKVSNNDKKISASVALNPTTFAECDGSFIENWYMYLDS